MKMTNVEIGLEAMQQVKDSRQPTEKRELDTPQHALLQELGFTRLSDELKKFAETSTKINMAALAGYTRIPRERFDAINERLREHTSVKVGNYGGEKYLTLKLTKVEDYTGIPPQDVLQEMKKAKVSGIFSDFQIITVKAEVVVPDPILVGFIEGCKDLFHIAEWGEDIKLRDFQLESETIDTSNYIDTIRTMWLHGGAGGII